MSFCRAGGAVDSDVLLITRYSKCNTADIVRTVAICSTARERIRSKSNTREGIVPGSIDSGARDSSTSAVHQIHCSACQQYRSSTGGIDAPVNLATESETRDNQ